MRTSGGIARTREDRPLRLSHRGDARRAPENTIAALLAGTGAPACDGVELDVRAARDGTPVLAHDETLERVFGWPERVDALSAAELDALGVPTLARVLGALPPRAFIDVELKEDVGAAVVPLLRTARGPELMRAVVASFEPAALRTVRALAPDWPTWLNAEILDADAVALAVDLGCTGISAGHGSITAASVGRARSAGLDVAAWTVRRVATFERLARLGVVAVCVEAAALDAP